MSEDLPYDLSLIYSICSNSVSDEMLDLYQQSCNIFWHTSCYRMSSERRNFEESVYIRLSDDGGAQSRIMSGDVLSIDAICTNGDIPSKIKCLMSRYIRSKKGLT